MHTKNKGKPKINNKTQAYNTAPPVWARDPGPGPGLPGPRPWGCLGLRFIVCLGFSFVFGMHMPLSGWESILGCL